MAELFKNIYNEKFFDRLTLSIHAIIPDFDAKSFLDGIYDNEWDDRELKQRMRHITVVLKKHLSEDYTENLGVILRLIPELQKHGILADNLECIFLPDFIEVYGMEYLEPSIDAFEIVTRFVSCEFAVRPFIIRYPEQMMRQMLLWSRHAHPSVRRLSTEGCRPRLPWAMAIPSLKANPEPIIPILENLKNDVSESVRRSVANNLNDISKDNPHTVIGLVTRWQGQTPEVDRLVKHACRTLLKQGNPAVMAIFGIGTIHNIEIQDFKIISPAVQIGDSVAFSFTLINASDVTAKIRLEYGLYYQKANGSLSRKIYKISEREYPKHSATSISRKQSFRIITTRRFHLGEHQVAIIVNGTEFHKIGFDLIV